ncbi:MAG: calcium/sodium antiporter [Coriobacteriales bacterium]|nr:calcium/sodium antiporter [Coriobacteriales bacterium]
MTSILSILALLLGFVLLIKGADGFVKGAGGFAARLGIPPLVVGLTIVALGTSAPEAAISIVSATQAADGITIANVFGSNIVNTLVILGVTAFVAEIPIRRTTLVVDLPFVLGITALLLALCLHDGSLGRIDAFVLLGLLVAYLCYVVRTARNDAADDQPAQKTTDKPTPMPRLALLAGAGAAGIFVGGQLVVNAATELARMAGVSDRLIGLTIVALGTSLPELVTSISAARQGQTDIAIGNVTGSSILNILFVLGMSGAIAPIPFAQELLLDGIVSLAAAGLLWLACVRTQSLRRAGGATLLTGYATYMAYVLGTSA